MTRTHVAKNVIPVAISNAQNRTCSKSAVMKDDVLERLAVKLTWGLAVKERPLARTSTAETVESNCHSHQQSVQERNAIQVNAA
jgi:hypothetical protein